MGKYCTAHMRVTHDNNDIVTVNYCKTHYNHNPEDDIGHLRLPEHMKISIAAKLLQGVKVDRILDDIRDLISDEGVHRKNLTTKQDIRNISRQYNIDGIERHSNDHTSVCSWIKEMQSLEFDPVIIFKEQGIPSCEEGVLPDDFLLALQDQFQLDMMKAFGGNIICIDATHGTNVYDYLLITLTVIDDYEEGIPVAWAITTREDMSMIKYFLSSLKKKTGAISPSVFMSDDANQYWNAWSSVFDSSNTRKVLCAWHVDRAWRKALQEHVVEVETRIELYHHLRVLQSELDETKFQLLLQQFTSLAAANHSRFYEYFSRFYGNRTEQWASCYRKFMSINTNMYVESFHRLLKVVYLEHKQNRRFDHLIHTLCKISRDKAFQHLQKAYKGKVTYRISEIHHRHKTAEKMISDGCSITAVSDSSWTVPSQHSITSYYTVSLLDQDICQCKMRCSFCGTCVHMYSCSCADWATHSTVCKHIHVVAINKECSEDLDTTPNSSDSLTNGSSQPQLSDTADMAICSLQVINGSLEKKKKMLLNKVAELQLLVTKCNDVNALDVSNNHIGNAVSVLIALQDNPSISQLPVRKRPSSNALAEKQSFYSTRQKKATVKTLAKPSSEEIIKCKEVLKDVEIIVCAICLKEDDSGHSEDIDWMQCLKCKRWFHLCCLQQDNAVSIDHDYHCTLCSNNAHS